MTAEQAQRPDRRADRRRAAGAPPPTSCSTTTATWTTLDAAVDALWRDRLRALRAQPARPASRSDGRSGATLADYDPTGRRSTPGWPPGSGTRCAAPNSGSTTSAPPRCPACPPRTSIDIQLTVDSLARGRRARRAAGRRGLSALSRATGGTSPRHAGRGAVGEAPARQRRPGPAGQPAPAGGRLAGLAVRPADARPPARRRRGTRRVPGTQAGTGGRRPGHRQLRRTPRSPGSTSEHLLAERWAAAHRLAP